MIPRWEVTYVRPKRLDRYLADGWEPFAVTETTEYGATVWLRRQVSE